MSYKIVMYTLQRLLCIHYFTCVACKRPIYREVSFCTNERQRNFQTRGYSIAKHYWRDSKNAAQRSWKRQFRGKIRAEKILTKKYVI
jgi:hypothetical protein